MTYRKPKILIVDDEKDICKFVKLLFRKRGFLVYSALSGRQAINTAKKVKPNIALLDIHFKKGLSGLDVLKWIRKFIPKCQCAMVTWDKAQEKVKTARKLGAVAYLTKPLTIKELAKVVGRLAKKIESEAR